MQGGALEYRVAFPLNLRRAVSDWAYLKTQVRFLLGAKLSERAMTNASVEDLALAFAFYANPRGGMVSREPHATSARRVGAFDSAHYRTRWGAARAILKQLRSAGWQVTHLTDGTVAVLSASDYEILLTATSPALQEKVLRKFNQANEPTSKQQAAQLLSHLWQAGFLSDAIKEELAQEHYHLVMRQLATDGFPSWDVRSEQTFPFPEANTDFTPTLFLNNQIKWSPGRSQLTCAMNATGLPITSMSGGEFKNGDVLQCRIVLAQKVKGHAWQSTLWTTKVVLQGLKR